MRQQLAVWTVGILLAGLAWGIGRDRLLSPGELVPGALAETETGEEHPAWVVVGEPFRWSGALRRGQRLVVETVNGEIRAEAGAGAEGRVEGVRRARQGREWQDVEIRVEEYVEEYQDVVRISVRHSKEERRDAHPVRVDFRVVVPAGIAFASSTVNGSIRAEGLSGPIEASAVNGTIRVGGAEEISASAVNGNIYAAAGGPKAEAAVRLETVNGKIELTLPDDAGAEIAASAVHGTISTEFPLTVRGEFGSRRLDGRLGSGGPRYELSTVNGSIRLRKPGA